MVVYYPTVQSDREARQCVVTHSNGGPGSLTTHQGTGNIPEHWRMSVGGGAL